MVKIMLCRTRTWSKRKQFVIIYFFTEALYFIYFFITVILKAIKIKLFFSRQPIPPQPPIFAFKSIYKWEHKQPAKFTEVKTWAKNTTL